MRHLRHTGLEVVAHIVLLLLVAGEDTDLADVGPQETVENGIAERASATGNQQHLILKNTHIENYVCNSRKKHRERVKGSDPGPQISHLIYKS